MRLSVQQTAQRSTRRTTSPLPAVGRSISSMRTSRRPWKTAAFIFMVSESSLVFQLSRQNMRRLHPALGERRVGVDGAGEFLDGQFRADGCRRLGDELGGVRADDLCAEQLP